MDCKYKWRKNSAIVWDKNQNWKTGLRQNSFTKCGHKPRCLFGKLAWTILSWKSQILQPFYCSKQWNATQVNIGYHQTKQNSKRWGTFSNIFVFISPTKMSIAVWALVQSIFLICVLRIHLALWCQMSSSLLFGFTAQLLPNDLG